MSNDKLVTVLYEFILFELSRCENELTASKNAYFMNKTQQNNFAVVESWVKQEYFRKIAGDLHELIKYCTEESTIQNQ